MLAMVLAGCAASAPPPAPTPPSPAIVAMVRPPAAVAPAPTAEETVRTIDHQFWSITVPGQGWEVTDDSETGVTVSRTKTATVTPAMLQVISQPLDGTEPEQFVVMMSVMAQQNVPEGTTVTDVKRKAGIYNGHTSSLTQVLTDKGVFIGVLAQVDEANKTGYVVMAIAPMVPEDAKVMGAISRSFTLKTAAPPEPEATPAPTPAPKKATPKKK